LAGVNARRANETTRVWPGPRRPLRVAGRVARGCGDRGQRAPAKVAEGLTGMGRFAVRAATFVDAPALMELEAAARAERPQDVHMQTSVIQKKTRGLTARHAKCRRRR
jgi:hypothetical protein